MTWSAMPYSLGKTPWPGSRTADFYDFWGTKAGAEIPVEIRSSEQITHWFILHGALLNKSHRKGSIIMQSFCPRTGQFRKPS